MAGASKKPRNGKFRGWYRSRTGIIKFFTGSESRKETIQAAKVLEDKEYLEWQTLVHERKFREAPDEIKDRPFGAVAAEYKEWGAAQGGRGGRPWSKSHLKHVRYTFDFWQESLNLKTLNDIHLADVERVLREKIASGSTGKTASGLGFQLKTFCRWAVKRNYLVSNPLRELGRFTTAPAYIRRALTPAEVGRLLAVAPPHRRLLYETALVTGLRANELRSLRLHHIDLKRGGLRIEAETTKSKRPAFQPVPAAILARLKAFAESGGPGKHYKNPPEGALLFVTLHTERMLKKDLTTAGVPLKTVDGKLDFHSLRHTFVSLIIEAGASATEAKELARHASLSMTSIYSHARVERLAEVVGNLPFCQNSDANCDGPKGCGTGFQDLSRRPRAPKARALTKLRHTPRESNLETLTRNRR